MRALTLSAVRPNETSQTNITTVPAVSNADFLRAIFTELQTDERPITLSIAGVVDATTRWGVGAAWTGESATDDKALNWYFTLSTYRAKDGKFRRVKAQFCRAFGVYLDDVGTKAAPRERLDACPPSYLVETSAGNYQAGYLFDQPCGDLARVEALQESLVKAGLCDPGAKGPSSRLGRLPRAINGKHSPPQQCRLIEWHPERRYSIDRIADLLELEPAEPAGSRRRTRTRSKAEAIDRNAEADVYRPRTAENAVLTALRQRGLYKQPLGSGKHDVTCPWVHEHTASIDHGAAYFEPNDLYPVGGFKCQHAHGAEKRVGALLEFLGVTFTEAKHKPAIRVAAGELHRVVDAAERELAAGGRHYQRGGLIVSVGTDPGTNETSIKPVVANGLMRALSSCATWERYDARSEDYVVIDPPTKHVSVLFDAESYQHLPVLRGVARQPYLRPDGSLVLQAGFDSASGMFGAFDERQFSIKAAPALEDAKKALAELRNLLSEFRFAQLYDEAAALALILTAAIRPTLPVAPMGHLKAPLPASGKSYLQGLIAAFAGPGKASAYAFPTSEEECAKLLLAALLEAPAVVAFDNLTTDLIPFKTLCSALTEEFITGRVLGVSKTATVPTATLILSSGNNVDPVRDMARRVLTVTLDPQCETPATIKYLGDPQEELRRERSRFVALALTIVRGYVVAGFPRTGGVADLPPLGGYGEWTRLVRSPLVWLGMPDPATAIFGRMAQDPDRETLGRLQVAWAQAFGTEAAAVRDVVARAEPQNFGVGGDSELLDVLREIAEEKGVINRRRLGRWIARHQGRIVDGRKFVRDAPAGGAERWRVVVVMLVPVVSVGHGAESVSCEPAAAKPTTGEPRQHANGAESGGFGGIGGFVPAHGCAALEAGADEEAF